MLKKIKLRFKFIMKNLLFKQSFIYLNFIDLKLKLGFKMFYIL